VLKHAFFNNVYKGSILQTSNKLHLNEHGFSPIIGIIAIVIVIGLAFGGWYVMQKQDDNKKNDTNQTNSQDDTQKDAEKDDTEPIADPTEGWKAYQNSSYGISFKYPTEWNIEEVPGEPDSSGIRTEHSINLKLNENIKYSQTIAIEVRGTNIDGIETEYDRLYSGAPSNPASKTATAVDGKSALLYTLAKSPTKTYLIDMNSKTYIFRSLNDELNESKDSNYWVKFDNVLKSLELN
jgi:cytoskeletal protein RodZ